jgi:pheromone shutdown-related protein TraB
LNFLQVIKKKQLPTLLVSLILSSYQKKLSRQTGIAPGSEMLEADRLAKEKNIQVSFADRDARITLKRAWRKTSFFKKLLLLSNLLASFFDNTQISEEAISELKESDLITEMMNELAAYLPSVKTVLIDERDLFLAEKIKEVQSEKILAVVGAGHIEGIKKSLTENRRDQIKEIIHVPPPALSSRIIGWSIPLVIIMAIFLIGYSEGIHEAKDNVIFWILANGSFCALGAIIGLAHPLTVISGFVAAPFTSLTPVIGAAYVTAFVQALVSPPSVKEMQNAGKDFYSPKMWWKNKTLKIFLAFLLPGLGSFIGSIVGGYEIISNLFG